MRKWILSKTKLHISIFLLALFIALSCSRQANDFLEEPKHNDNDFYIRHMAYSLVYNEANEQADWVSYQLLASELTPNFIRSNKFTEDTLVITGTANNKDYLHSGFDRGHLAPAADMTWNKQAMAESFYFSNIVPQLPVFNRGKWKKLEFKVRKWVKKYDCLYVATGPICQTNEQTIGENKVSVPSYFYKTILIFNDSIGQGIAFLFPHQKCENELFSYAISIDSLELITGKDFYFALPNKIEKNIEKQYNLSFWR
jgi:endonuclease G, mitochondrial